MSHLFWSLITPLVEDDKLICFNINSLTPFKFDEFGAISHFLPCGAGLGFYVDCSRECERGLL